MIQFITHCNDHIGYYESAMLALEGGCRWIQLRMKEASDDEVCSIAIPLAEKCRQLGATFILDDRVHLVKEVNAHGVHIGKNDMPVDEARAILGKDFIIGGTANTIEDVERIWHGGADYIGCGPFRFTTTKKNLSTILGLEGYENILAEMGRRNIDIPLVAIGGITLADIDAIKRTGVQGIAVSGAVLNAENPIEEMRKFVEKENIK